MSWRMIFRFFLGAVPQLPISAVVPRPDRGAQLLWQQLLVTIKRPVGIEAA